MDAAANQLQRLGRVRNIAVEKQQASYHPGKSQVRPGGPAPDCWLFLSQSSDQWKLRWSHTCGFNELEPSACPSGVYLCLPGRY